MLIKPPDIVSPTCNPTFDECARMQIIPEINTVTPTIARTANHFVARDMYIFICYPPRQIQVCLTIYIVGGGAFDAPF